MSIFYTSPHDNPKFGPPPEWEKVEHCYGENCDTSLTEDGDRIQNCDGYENCDCECEDCKDARKKEEEQDDGPEYDKYDRED